MSKEPTVEEMLTVRVEKSLMKLAEDLGVPFSSAKIIHDEATRDQPRTVTREQITEWTERIIKANGDFKLVSGYLILFFASRGFVVEEK